MDSFVNETADAFANLATATASHRQMLANLTTADKELTTHLTTKDTKIAQLQAKIQELQRNNQYSRPGRTGGKDDSGNTRKFNNTN
jgi:phage shock protein A